MKRSRRDTYLGAAAAVLVVMSLMQPVGTALNVATLHARVVSSWMLWWLLPAVIGLALPAGYLLISRGFLGTGIRRDSRLRRAAQVWVVGYSASLVVAAIGLILVAVFGGPSDSYLYAHYGISLAGSLLSVLAAVRVVRAFASPIGSARRNRLLGWAVLLGWGSIAITSLFLSVGPWIRHLVFGLDIGYLIDGMLWVSAMAVAALAFWKAGAFDRSAATQRMFRRERYLFVSALLILLAGLWDSVGTVGNAIVSTRSLDQVYGDFGHLLGPWWSMWCQLWLPVVRSVALVVAAGLAVMAFVQSRRAFSVDFP